jgi:hypothetical protein
MSACAMFIIESDQGIIFGIQHNVKLLKADFFYLILVCGVLLPKFACIHVKTVNIIN